MPFEEIGKNEKYVVTITKNQLRISSDLLRYFQNNNIEHVKLLHDKENQLFAFKVSSSGYSVKYNTISCRKLPKEIPCGKFVGNINLIGEDLLSCSNPGEKIIIFDLKSPL